MIKIAYYTERRSCKAKHFPEGYTYLFSIYPFIQTNLAVSYFTAQAEIMESYKVLMIFITQM